MKAFEGLEDCLKDVGCVDNLLTALLANGVENIVLDKCGATFFITPWGFAKNVPVSKWDVSDVETYGGKIKFFAGDVTIVCEVNLEEIDKLKKQYGVKFKFDKENDNED